MRYHLEVELDEATAPLRVLACIIAYVPADAPEDLTTSLHVSEMADSDPSLERFALTCLEDAARRNKEKVES